METDTLLREAIRADDWPRLRAILQEHGLDVNIRYCKDERTPLTVAVWLGSGRIVRHLIDAGADVNTGMEYDRMTPLHWACRYGRAEIARALVTANAKFSGRKRTKRNAPPLCQFESVRGNGAAPFGGGCGRPLQKYERKAAAPLCVLRRGGSLGGC